MVVEKVWGDMICLECVSSLLEGGGGGGYASLSLNDERTEMEPVSVEVVVSGEGGAGLGLDGDVESEEQESEYSGVQLKKVSADGGGGGGGGGGDGDAEVEMVKDSGLDISFTGPRGNETFETRQQQQQRSHPPIQYRTILTRQPTNTTTNTTTTKSSSSSTSSSSTSSLFENTSIGIESQRQKRVWFCPLPSDIPAFHASGKWENHQQQQKQQQQNKPHLHLKPEYIHTWDIRNLIPQSRSTSTSTSNSIVSKGETETNPPTKSSVPDDSTQLFHGASSSIPPVIPFGQVVCALCKFEKGIGCIRVQLQLPNLNHHHQDTPKNQSNRTKATTVSGSENFEEDAVSGGGGGGGVGKGASKSRKRKSTKPTTAAASAASSSSSLATPTTTDADPTSLAHHSDFFEPLPDSKNDSKVHTVMDYWNGRCGQLGIEYACAGCMEKCLFCTECGGGKYKERHIVCLKN
jgi:hypothetical protein